jgi:hypothetical protein
MKPPVRDPRRKFLLYRATYLVPQARRREEEAEKKIKQEEQKKNTIEEGQLKN